MAPFIESLSRGLVCGSLVEGKKEHAPQGAEALFLARRMPSGPESLRREDNPFPAGLRDCVAAFFFERAHEGGDSCPAGADSGGTGNEVVPFSRAGFGCAMPFDGLKHGQFEDVGVTIGEPLAAEKSHAPYCAEELCVASAQCGAHRVFANVASKCRELPVSLDYPIMPVFVEDVAGWCFAALAASREWCFAALAASLRRRAGRNTRRAGRNTRYAGRALRGVARCRVCGNDPPVFVAQCFRQLVYDYAECHAVGRGLYLDHQMNVVGHYDEGRNWFDAPPFLMKCADDSLKGDGNVVAHEKPVFCDSGKVGKPRQALERHHVEERCLVVKIEESGHRDSIAIICLRRRAGRNTWGAGRNTRGAGRKTGARNAPGCCALPRQRQHHRKE